MDKNVLQSIAGVEIYPLISLAIFFFFFLGLLLYVMFANRKHLHTMSELPLRSDEELHQHLTPDVIC